MHSRHATRWVGSNHQHFEFSSKSTWGKNVPHICGTRGYMAPEVPAGFAYSGTAADIWSLGCILLDLCLGLYGTPRELRFKRRDFHAVALAAAGGGAPPSPAGRPRSNSASSASSAALPGWAARSASW